jgi:DNA-binding CsgD family transcriptional regulator
MSDEQNPLSEREMEIVQLVATGATNQQIARDLVISVNTVKVHLRNIYTKLEVGSRTEATMLAVRQGWVEVPRAGEDAADEDVLGGTQALSLPPVLPQLERWPRVPLAKRIALIVAMLVAMAALLVPQALYGGVNGRNPDPIGDVFPTVTSGTSANRWRTGAQMPTPRTHLAVAAHNGLVYAIGGVSDDGATDQVEIYDPEADAWTSGSPKPTAAGYVSAVVVGDQIYVPGGIGVNVGPLKVLEVYDPGQDRWESRAPMPEPLGAYGLAVYEDQLYLFGGRRGQDYVASVYRYDPAADRWETLEPMEEERGLLGAAPLGERIYVVGGYDGENEFESCDAYDPVTGDWIACASMSMRRGGLAVVPVRGHLFAIGGGMTNYLAFNERYDPGRDVWSRVETPISEQWRGLGVDFLSPYIYAIGGWSDGFLSVNESYQALFLIFAP